MMTYAGYCKQDYLGNKNFQREPTLISMYNETDHTNTVEKSSKTCFQLTPTANDWLKISYI